jgi:hypothetical protein
MSIPDSSSNTDLLEQIKVLTQQVASLMAERGQSDTTVQSDIKALPNMVSELSKEEDVILDTYIRRLSKDLASAKVVLFDGGNWLIWERIVKQDLIPLRVMSYLTHQTTPTTLNSLTPFDRQKFTLCDMKICNYLQARLGPVAAKAVYHDTSAYLIWSKLLKLHSSSSVITQNRLRDSWALTTQQPAQSVTEWIQHVDYLAASMSAAHLPIDDASKLHRLLRGLSNEWAHEKRHFELTRSSYEEVCSALYELGEQQDHDRQLTLAFQAKTQPGPSRPGLGRGSFRGARKPITCYTCGSSDHSQERCPTGLKPTVGENGRRLSRCFTCLKEGHVAKECKMVKRKVFPPHQALAVLHEAQVTPPVSLEMDGQEGS